MGDRFEAAEACSPEGRAPCARSTASTPPAVERIDHEGRVSRAWEGYAFPSNYIAEMSVAPDGKQIALALRLRHADVWMLEGLAEHKPRP